MLARDDEVGTQLRRLCDSYDDAIHRPCIMPELKALQIKNDQRRSDHQRHDDYQRSHLGHQQTLPQPPAGTISTGIDLSITRGDSTTMIQSFKETPSKSKIMGGRSIFNVITERQAQFRASKDGAS